MNTRESLPVSPISGRHLCVYCGRDADSDDHTPPQCLLRRPLPSNLMTLPACRACNESFSFDENVVRVFLALSSPHPHWVAARQPGGVIERALTRDSKLRAMIEAGRQSDGSMVWTDATLRCFQRVFVKTVQGLFHALYGRVVRAEELQLDVVDDRRRISREEIAERYRPNPLEDITDKAMSPVTASSWQSRQNIIILKCAPVSGGPPVNRAFRLKRETPIEWVTIQPGVFTFGFVKSENENAACVMELWESMVVTVKAPWPGTRGPLRKGKKNPLSRE